MTSAPEQIPRYPLISEIKAMYLKAFYGEVPAEAAEA